LKFICFSLLNQSLCHCLLFFLSCFFFSFSFLLLCLEHFKSFKSFLFKMFLNSFCIFLSLLFSSFFSNSFGCLLCFLFSLSFSNKFLSNLFLFFLLFFSLLLLFKSQCGLFSNKLRCFSGFSFLIGLLLCLLEQKFLCFCFFNKFFSGLLDFNLLQSETFLLL